MKIKKLGLATLLAFCYTLSISQTRPTPPPTPPTPGNTAGSPAPVTPRSTIKPYKEVITDKAVSKKGLFTVHKVEDKYFFEIADSTLNREIMAVTRFIKVPYNKQSGYSTFGGELTNNQTITFERGPSNNVFMRVVTLVNVSDTSNVISRAVSNSNLNAIAAAFPIAAYGKDSASVVIEVTDFFKGDNQVVSISPSSKRMFGLGSLATDRSYISTIQTFPINTEIRTVKTFNASPSPGGLTTAAQIPAASSAGAVTVELNTSLMLLPKVPMQVRYYDRRVGFFRDHFTTFNDQQQRVQEKNFAVRWRLEPKDEDVDNWKRGELVEPKKPIIYYIDPATPRKWRSFLIQGINDWQVAFEAAGFKNAIVGKEWPENDSSMSLEDARFSVLRYFASDIENAYGPNVHDPRSGEILESHIGWYHNVMKLVHNWFFIQAGAVNPRARKMEFDDDLMGQLIRFVSSHEVGHTIGLAHNMGSSSTVPVEKLRDKAWVEKNGHTPSIMDYARFNYVAQPEDNIADAGLFPRIGDYDKWAIRWGYGYIPGETEAEQKAASNKLIIETIKNNPRTWFGTYEQGNQNDPRSQREDLGDNAMKASEYGIKNLKVVLKNLADWTKEENDQYENLQQMYGALIGQFRQYMSHVVNNVGGVYQNFKSSMQDEPVYEVTPKAIQRDAVNFLHKQLFQTPEWLINNNYMNRLNNLGTSDPLGSAQESILTSLMSNDRLSRLQASALRFGDSKAYNAIELLNDIQSGLFTELNSKKAIDFYRRGLQKSYVTKLDNMLNPPSSSGMVIMIGGSSSAGSSTRNDMPAIARGQLLKLRTQVNAAIAGTTDNMSKLHLLDLQERIKRALDPKA
ncbi:zinc-dependent metalloprotease [Aridibaculum aurantiacum]|uniref:zinc-dependent metalloprotease n=1 Tax=Aridibaculum aurantiacum TaxID=2810307 RepID=UPI001A977DD2|nr:zinc-dependent metalloprotease [Aridibaculum aurantiacum]